MDARGVDERVKSSGRESFHTCFQHDHGLLSEVRLCLDSETDVCKERVTSNFSPQQVSTKCWREKISHRLTVGEKSIAKDTVDSVQG